jgi:hypothetical protein
MHTPEAQTAKSPEKVFYESQNVKVTNVRFITNKQTYVMRNVSSVKSTRTKGPRIGAGVFLGLVTCLWAMGFYDAFNGHSDSGMLIFGMVTAIFASVSISFFIQKYDFNVVLTTNSGEAPALTSPDEALISAVITALNEALVHG